MPLHRRFAAHEYAPWKYALLSFALLSQYADGIAELLCRVCSVSLAKFCERSIDSGHDRRWLEVVDDASVVSSVLHRYAVAARVSQSIVPLAMSAVSIVYKRSYLLTLREWLISIQR